MSESAKPSEIQDKQDNQDNPNNKQADSNYDMERYSRQIRFAPFGSEGQRRLSTSHALVIGAGALGTGIAETLVRSGIGTLTIADRDYVEWSNLQRQQLYDENDAITRTPKAIAALHRLTAINSSVKIHAHVLDVNVEELEELIAGADIIMDATDNFDTRLLINDIACKHGIPWVYGGCVGSYGITYTFIPGKTPCLNCLLGSVPLGGDTCDTSGILPQAVQLVTAHQTSEALKLLSGHEDVLRDKLLSFDVWRNEQVAIGVNNAKKTDCPSCGPAPRYPYLDAANRQKTDVLCGRDTVQIRPSHKVQISLKDMAEQLERAGAGQVTMNPFLLSLDLGENRIVLFPDGRALIHGTKDIARARSLYHRYFG